MCTSYELSCRIVNDCIDAGTPITNVCLQGALALIQRHVPKESAAYFNERCVDRGYGPMYPHAYKKFMRYVTFPITKRCDFDPLAGREEDSSIREALAIGRKSAQYGNDWIMSELQSAHAEQGVVTAGAVQ